jgi:hypothetical protein
MAYPAVTYTFTNGTTASATEVNQNFTDLINGLSDGTKDLSISALTVAGTASLNGAVNIGNATSDDIAVNGYITTALIPKADDSYDLGTAALAWQDGYFDGKVYTDSIKALTSSGVTITDDGDVACVTCADGGAVTVGPASNYSTSHTVWGVYTQYISASSGNIIKTDSNAASSTTAIAFRRADNGDCGEIVVNCSGNSTAYSTTSDSRMKDDCGEFSGVDSVMSMKPRLYKWKNFQDGSPEIGFFAQELYLSAPYAVVKPEDENRTWGVDYGRITPILVKALQELSAKLDEANARIAALEAK